MRSGEKADEEVTSRREAGLLEQRHELVACGARVGGRLEHHQLARLEHAGQRGAGGDQRLKIGLAVAGEGSWNRDDDRLDLGQVGVARGRVEALSDRAERLVRHVLHVRLALRQRIGHARIGVHAHHVVTRLAERDGERKADVAEAYYSDFHRR